MTTTLASFVHNRDTRSKGFNALYVRYDTILIFKSAEYILTNIWVNTQAYEKTNRSVLDVGRVLQPVRGKKEKKQDMA